MKGRRWFMGCALLYPWLFIWQGLDFTDLGYFASSYQLFFESPEAVEVVFLNWLTFAAGALLHKCFGFLGLIGFKAGYALTINLTVVAAYRFLRPFFEARVIWFGLLVTTIFITKACADWFSYNSLSALLFALAALCSLRGLMTSSYLWLGLCGYILGLNVFVRLPNLLGLGLIALILGFGWSHRWSWPKIGKMVLAFFISFVLALVTIYVLMVMLRHDGYYLDSLNRLLGVAASTDNTHSGNRLLSTFFRDHWHVAVYGGSFAVVLFVAAWFSNLWAELKVVNGLILCIIIGVGSLLVTWGESWRWVYPGVMYLSLALIAFLQLKRNPALGWSALIAFFFLLITPLGSSNGIRNAIYGLWLAMPLVITWLLSNESFQWRKRTMGPVQMRFLRTCFIGITLLSSLVVAYGYTYRDANNRVRLRYSVEHPLLKGVFTTQARAEVAQELVDELERRVRPGDVLLAYPHLPLVHYLTESRPYLYNPWPLIYDKATLVKKMERAQKQFTDLPLVVRSTGYLANTTWPSGDPVFRLGPRELESGNVLNQFVSDHGYQVMWNNSYFEILVPGEPKPIDPVP